MVVTTAERARVVEAMVLVTLAVAVLAAVVPVAAVVLVAAVAAVVAASMAECRVADDEATAKVAAPKVAAA